MSDRCDPALCYCWPCLDCACIPPRPRIWFWRPQLHWFGWQTLIPIYCGADEYDRHTLMFGWTITGRLIIATRHCPGESCRVLRRRSR